MSATQEFYSWLTPPKIPTSPAPEVGQPAPSTARLKLPQSGDKLTILTFLRHCGCPFAEKTFLRLRETAKGHSDIHFIAVSHSSREHTDKWLHDIGGTNPDNLEVVVDDKREIYAAWGLGVASFWHVLNPMGLYDVFRLARDDGISNRPTESGFRFQTSGSWAVDGQGKVVWGGVAASANEIPNLDEAVQALERK
ncbi:hypothetical protein M406DRAFT_340863 [Cryphonectria parasitica EP155]|uniref:Thioredoxin domain-containing protein n=1 Tax=Cryphonectria parasitica (strain ATCC 38755 / EP155) TaxID=660469 RepID=A0A9P4XXS3_CRYP1|nr:uncharacterized protein M406DRAFT_340863 [Cryphonectria parasitica EP155]KAF3763239.1 hypothetical protein M406DRAFT_340863 [Cryphonectria parasitica EP155]